ncbi:hypothetical protein [Nocardioides sp. KR10-350]|uniref:hypothetical protein n=1 Tax=Nocardioides cheoyonin TaxID=3156615 RepID=UPI0032B312A6
MHPPEASDPADLPDDLHVLFSHVLASFVAEADSARARGDVPGFRFWCGQLDIVDAMRRDLVDDPREAPEVRRFLQRALRAL